MDHGTLAGIDNWPLIQQRYEAWWQGQVVDRVLIGITAPKCVLPAEDVPADQLLDYWTNPDRVIPRWERGLAATYYCGDAFPTISPLSGGMVGVLAAFLGAPIRFVDTHTTWTGPIIRDWASRPPLVFDINNEWWLRTKCLLEAGAHRALGRYLITIPDLNGPGEILARLRGAAALCFDLLEETEPLPAALQEINQAWYRYFLACHGVVHQYVPGYTFWMGMWSELPAADLQTDFSIMISSAMFDRFFLPHIEEQTRLVQRTIYHLDGPGAVRHLESLLDLPLLTAIQWVPGAGAPPVSAWLPLLRRIQARGKGLWLSAEPWEVPVLLEALEPEGLCIKTQAPSPEAAGALLGDATRLWRRHHWLMPGTPWEAA